MVATGNYIPLSIIISNGKNVKFQRAAEIAQRITQICDCDVVKQVLGTDFPLTMKHRAIEAEHKVCKEYKLYLDLLPVSQAYPGLMENILSNVIFIDNMISDLEKEEILCLQIFQGLLDLDVEPCMKTPEIAPMKDFAWVTLDKIIHAPHAFSDVISDTSELAELARIIISVCLANNKDYPEHHLNYIALAVELVIRSECRKYMDANSSSSVTLYPARTTQVNKLMNELRYLNRNIDSLVKCPSSLFGPGEIPGIIETMFNKLEDVRRKIDCTPRQAPRSSYIPVAGVGHKGSGVVFNSGNTTQITRQIFMVTESSGNTLKPESAIPNSTQDPTPPSIGKSFETKDPGNTGNSESPIPDTPDSPPGKAFFERTADGLIYSRNSGPCIVNGQNIPSTQAGNQDAEGPARVAASGKRTLIVGSGKTVKSWDRGDEYLPLVKQFYEEATQAAIERLKLK